jgi:PIN domain nuclease of toxin-antitoxin system
LKLLLDSHILLWWPAGSPKLGSRARDMIVAVESELFVSAASWWELGIKRALGRLRIDLVATRRAIKERGVAGLPVSMEHAEFAAGLDKLHGDPFDHMLVAQAMVEDCKLLTRDERLKAYGPSVLCV